MKTYSLDLADSTIEVHMRKHHWAKRVNLKVRSDGQVVVTLPKRSPYRVGESFVNSNVDWIEAHLQKNPTINTAPPTSKQREESRKVIERKVALWAEAMHVEYNRIAIRNQRTRWGSCSSKKNLNFNWRLAHLDDELIDYVVVHELAHLNHLNHSQQFYGFVEHFIPNYRQVQKKLAEASTFTLQ